MSLNFGGEPSYRSQKLDYNALLVRLRKEFVDQSGDIMTGNLIIPRGTRNEHAVTRKQVENFLQTQKGRLEDKIEEERKKLEDQIKILEANITSASSNVLVTVDNNRRSVLVRISEEKAILERSIESANALINTNKTSLLTKIQDEITKVYQSISTLTSTINSLNTQMTSKVRELDNSVEQKS